MWLPPAQARGSLWENPRLPLRPTATTARLRTRALGSIWRNFLFAGDAGLSFGEARTKHDGACEVGTSLNTVTRVLLPHMPTQMTVATMDVRRPARCAPPPATGRTGEEEMLCSPQRD